MVRLGAGVVVCTIVIALASGSAWSGDRTTASVLHFYERQGLTSFIDNAPKGKDPTPGDVFVSTNPVFTRQGGRVGSDHGVCTVIRAKPFVAQCSATLQLPNGQLMLQSLNTATASFSEAVIGGTGAFNGASGLLTTHSVGKTDTINITLK